MDGWMDGWREIERERERERNLEIDGKDVLRNPSRRERKIFGQKIEVKG